MKNNIQKINSKILELKANIKEYKSNLEDEDSKNGCEALELKIERRERKIKELKQVLNVISNLENSVYKYIAANTFSTKHEEIVNTSLNNEGYVSYFVVQTIENEYKIYVTPDVFTLIVILRTNGMEFKKEVKPIAILGDEHFFITKMKAMDKKG